MKHRKSNHKRISLKTCAVSLDQKAFTLIEVLMATGLLGIVALGMATLTTNMQKEQRRLSETMQIQNSVNLSQLIFTNTEQCTCQLKGKNFNSDLATNPSIDLTELNIYSDPSTCLGPKSLAMTTAANNPAKLQTLRLNGITAAGTNQYFAKIQFTFSGAQDVNRELDVMLTTSTAAGTATITNCGAASAGAVACPCGACWSTVMVPDPGNCHADKGICTPNGVFSLCIGGNNCP
ncbi:MAG: hypothetical protein A2X94_05750 [Bdellovibrionales bacterium GWB1_55_8]|nr:MAG: hypothetical protein A2X94_05750 [Bdellovibrionales bacterium GWB1_55_8]